MYEGKIPPLPKRTANKHTVTDRIFDPFLEMFQGNQDIRENPEYQAPPELVNAWKTIQQSRGKPKETQT